MRGKTRGKAWGKPARPLALVVLAALLATGLAGCKEPGEGSVTVKPAFLPVSFTIDSAGNISVSADAKIVTPLGEVSVGGFQQRLVSGKNLVVLIRHLAHSATTTRSAAFVQARDAQGTGYVYSAYEIHTKGRHVRPSLDGRDLALAQGGTVLVDATRTQPGKVTRLQIADAPKQQDSPVPTSSASSCAAGTGDIGITLPEVSAGADVDATVAQLAADCLQVQYAAEPADGVEEGTVSRVVIPTADAAGTVRLPPADDTAPQPGDRVTASRRTPTTVYVTATPSAPSDPPTDSPTPTPTDTPTDTGPSGSATVTGAVAAPVRTGPTTADTQISYIEAGGSYQALCAAHGDPVQAHGYDSDLWVELLRATGGTGWVTATALTGGPDALSLPDCAEPSDPATVTPSDGTPTPIPTSTATE
ncbi:SH3 domain-containing protein [Streptomyces sp. NPDC001492]